MWKISAIFLICAISLVYGNNEEEIKKLQKIVDFKLAADSNQIFSKNFFSFLQSSEPGNFICSPLSAQFALGLTWLGAREKTRSEISDKMGLGSEQNTKIEQVFTVLREELLSKNRDGIDTRIANKIYAANSLVLSDDYRKSSLEIFDTEPTNVNFGDPNTRQMMNDWVKSVTENKIKNAVKEGSVNSNTKLAIVNALYFKGTWQTEFDKRSTMTRNFHLENTQKEKTDFMFTAGDLKTAKNYNLRASILELPYKGDELSLLVVLPDKGQRLANVESAMSSVNLERLMDSLFTTRDLRVTFPKFKMEISFDLKETLKQMGIREMFTASANFTGITNDPNASLYVSEAIQKTFIEFSEEGTEAASATGLYSTFLSANQPTYERFDVDRPFLFYVVHRKDVITAPVVLFAGRYVTPPKVQTTSQNMPTENFQPIEKPQKINFPVPTMEIPEKKIQNQPEESSNRPVESMPVSRPAESLSRPVESFNRPVESLNRPTESFNRTVESTNRPGESLNRTAESLNRTVESTSRPGESLNRTAESFNRTVESTNRTGESLNRTAESFNRPVESTNRPVDSLNHPVEGLNHPVESLTVNHPAVVSKRPQNNNPTQQMHLTERPTQKQATGMHLTEIPHSHSFPDGNVPAHTVPEQVNLPYNPENPSNQQHEEIMHMAKNPTPQSFLPENAPAKNTPQQVNLSDLTTLKTSQQGISPSQPENHSHQQHEEIMDMAKNPTPQSFPPENVPAKNTPLEVNLADLQTLKTSQQGILPSQPENPSHQQHGEIMHMAENPTPQSFPSENMPATNTPQQVNSPFQPESHSQEEHEEIMHMTEIPTSQSIHSENENVKTRKTPQQVIVPSQPENHEPGVNVHMSKGPQNQPNPDTFPGQILYSGNAQSKVRYQAPTERPINIGIENQNLKNPNFDSSQAYPSQQNVDLASAHDSIHYQTPQPQQQIKQQPNIYIRVPEEGAQQYVAGSDQHTAYYGHRPPAGNAQQYQYVPRYPPYPYLG